VTVTRFEQIWREPADPTDRTVRAAFSIECSSGTYVRSLIADLGDGYCLELRRTGIGPFRVGDAVALPPRGGAWLDPPLISPEHALAAAQRYVA
jgi:tRNA pseudouridine55 synthase